LHAELRGRKGYRLQRARWLEARQMASGGTPRVLSVQSHVVNGYVGQKCAVLALNRLGFDVDALNTVSLSNHTGYPTFTGQRLSGDDVKELWDGMQANRLTNHTHVLSGYIGDASIVEQLAAIVSSLPGRKEYVADPVFGDEGKLYVPSVIPERFEKLLLPLATVLTPNDFEVELLTGIRISTLADALRACGVLFDKGRALRTVVITSCSLSADDVTLVACHRESAEAGRILVSRVARLDGYFTGTGDLLAALLLGWLHKYPGRNEEDLGRAVDHAVAGLQAVLRDTHRQVAGERRGERDKDDRGWWSRRDLRLVQNQDSLRSPPEALLNEVASQWVRG
jgi:pyridoxine kinase